MMERRRTLGGSMPRRTTTVRRPLVLPAASTFAEMRAGSGGNAVSTTMGFTRLLRNLCRDRQMGERVVPIIPDEGRTFGMDSLFKELEIYASQGQKYEPVDHDLLLSYTEDSDGQILEEGITEAGSMASFIAAATSYATRGVPMIPFYTFYSMFGFQRIGDLIWQAADMRARGLPDGRHRGPHDAARRRTPAPGRPQPAAGVDGAAGAGVRPGVRLRGRCHRARRHRAHVRARRRPTPSATSSTTSRSTTRTTRCRRSTPSVRLEVEEGVVRGLYRFAEAPDGPSKRATILFSGISHGAARAAATELAEHYDVGRRAVVGDLVQEAPRGGAGSRALEPSASVAGAARAARDAAARGDAGPDHRRQRLHAHGARADRPIRARGPAVQRARHRRHGSLRHARGVAPVLRDRHGRTSSSAC